MARRPTAGLTAALTATVAQPGYLVQITLPSQTFYLCTLGVGFSYGGHDWTAADVEVDDLRWDQGGTQGGKVTLGDADLVWWTFTLNLQLQDAPVAVWQVYADAPGEAEPLWSGRIGRIVKGAAAVTCDLVLDISAMYSPRRRVQNIVPAKYLLPAGRLIYTGSTQWTLIRKTNG